MTTVTGAAAQPPYSWVLTYGSGNIDVNGFGYSGFYPDVTIQDNTNVSVRISTQVYEFKLTDNYTINGVAFIPNTISDLFNKISEVFAVDGQQIKVSKGAEDETSHSFITVGANSDLSLIEAYKQSDNDNFGNAKIRAYPGTAELRTYAQEGLNGYRVSCGYTSVTGKSFEIQNNDVRAMTISKEGDIQFHDAVLGVIWRSPNGTSYRVTIDDTPNFVFTAI